MRFTVRAARSRLSRLIDAALAGAEVVIARGAKPVVRLVPIRTTGFRLGILERRLGTPPDSLGPLPDEAPGRWEGR